MRKYKRRKKKNNQLEVSVMPAKEVVAVLPDGL